MRIVVVGTRGFPNVQGGVETHCEELYPRLAERGCEVTVFARAPYVPFQSSCHEGVNLVAIDCPRSKNFETFIHTAKAVFKARAFQPDVLHIHSIGPSMFALAARLLGMKVVVTHHGENYKHKKWGFFASLCLRLCEAIGVCSANKVIVISDYLAAALKGKFNKKATIIPNGVSIPARVTTTDALEQFGVEKGKYFLAVGRFVPEKGFHDLIEAFGLANLAGWKLVIVGRADHEDAYSAKIRNMAMATPGVVLTGFQKGQLLNELYSHAGLFVVPSYYEGMSIVLLEALSYGLKCIVSDVPGNRHAELFPLHFFTLGDIKGLAREMSASVNQPLSEGERSEQVAMLAHKYDWDNIAEATLRVYQEAVGSCPFVDKHSSTEASRVDEQADRSTYAISRIDQEKKTPLSALRVSVTGLRGFPNVQGGIETHCEKLYTQLVKRGCEVSVFARSPYMTAGITEYRGVVLRQLRCPTNKYLETATHTFESIIVARRMSPDILHIHAIGPSLLTPLARALGMRVVVTTHGPDYERAKWNATAKVFLKFCERIGMKYAHEVIAIADNIAEDVKKKYNRTATVIPNGVEIPRPMETMEAVTRFGLEKGRYVLTVGRFVPEKGFHDLIEAFARAGLDGWKLAIVGRADHEDAYSARLQEQAGRNPDVVLTGFLKGAPLQELYSHAGLFVLPSYYEGLPIVLLEALSYGLNCISSGIRANRNIPLGEDRFFEPGNIDQMSALMARHVEAPLSEEERVSIRRFVEETYNWEDIAEKTISVYHKVIAHSVR